MNILLLTPFVPAIDARSGCPRAVFDRLTQLAPAHQITVVCFAEPDEKSAVNALRNQGIIVHTVPRSIGHRSRVARWRKRARLAIGLCIGRMPILVQEFDTREMRRLVRRVFTEGNFEMILVEHILMAQFLEELNRTAPVILTDHDVRGGLPEPRRHRGRFPRMSALLQSLDQQAWLCYRRRWWQGVQAVSVATVEDASVVRRLGRVEPVIIPFGLAFVVQQETTLSGSREENSLLFVGNYDHPPNVDAALWLAREILPLVLQACPAAHLFLVGKHPSPIVQALAGPHVTLTGEVPTLAPFFQRSAVFVAPLREGGGTRMKLIEAMGAGICCITTTLGARGLGAVAGRDLLVANDAAGIANLVREVLSDKERREETARAGQEFVQTPEHRTKRSQRLEALLQSVASRSVAARLPVPYAAHDTANQTGAC